MEIAVRHTSLTMKRAAASLFELAVSLSWMLVGVAILPNPTSVAAHSPVGRNVGLFASAWAVLFILGGALVIHGILRASPRTRVAGLLLLATGLLMEGVAAATFEMEPRVLIYFVYCIACVGRAFLVARENRPRGA